jgi:hypothetical protein
MSPDGAFRFALAGREDEPDIRALVGSLAMPGSVSVRFERQPDYFLGTTIQGDPCHVLIARHVPDGTLAALAVRAERRVWLGGEPCRLAYIGQIRVAPRFQGRWLMQRAALEVSQLHEPGLPYLGVIATDNPVALGTLTGRRRPGAPEVRRLARLVSLALVVHGRFRGRRPHLPVEFLSTATVEEAVAFLQRVGSGRDLFPIVTAQELLDGRSYRDLRLEDVAVVRRAGVIVGVLGSWDQSAYKQETVAGYGSRLARLRPAYDLMAWALGGRPLPAIGEGIRTAFGCLRCVADDDPDVLAALLWAALERAAGQGQAFLMLGFDERDPQLRQVPRWLRVAYRSEVFLGWYGPHDPSARLDGRPCQVEVGTL